MSQHTHVPEGEGIISGDSGTLTRDDKPESDLSPSSRISLSITAVQKDTCRGETGAISEHLSDQVVTQFTQTSVQRAAQLTA